MDLFEEHLPTSGHRSRAIRGLGLQITLAFVAGGIAAGFLNKIGSDLYEDLRKRLKLLLLKRAGKRRPRINGQLTVVFTDKRHGFASFSYRCSYSTDPDLERVFKTIGPLHEILLERWERRAVPFDVGDAFYVWANLGGREPGKWALGVWRLCGKFDKPTLDETFLATVDTRKLLLGDTTLIRWRRDPSG